MKKKRHTPEQIVKKLRTAGKEQDIQRSEGGNRQVAQGA